MRKARSAASAAALIGFVSTVLAFVFVGSAAITSLVALITVAATVAVIASGWSQHKDRRASSRHATLRGLPSSTAILRRKWTAIIVGTAMMAAVPVCFRLAEGFPAVVPTDITGSPNESAAGWLGAGLGLAILIPFVLAYVSGRERWGMAGFTALGATVATAVLGSVLSEELSGASATWTLVAAVIGGIALRHEYTSELTARVTAAALLFGCSLVLSSSGLPALLPFFTFVTLGIADAAAARFT